MQLHYKKMGEGQPLLILHGVFGSLDNWLTVGRTIADAGYAVYLLDQRDHGRSPQTDRLDFAAMASDLEKFIKEHSLINPILLGHSMGGKTVMQYAATHPGTFAKLVVVDIGPKPYPLHHGELLRGLNALPLDQIESRQQADERFSAYEPSVGVRQFLLKNLYRTDQGTFAWRFNLPLLTRDMKNVGDVIRIETPITEPTLFIRGENSHYIRDEDWAAIQEQFPHARLETIAGAGHWVQAEQPKAFVASLLTFLGE